jgi:hypothetical protein
VRYALFILDEAIEVALKIPAAWYGTVEVRPVCEM